MAQEALTSKETLPGVFVDVQGTLLLTARPDYIEKINEELMTFLVGLLDHRVPVTVITGGCIEDMQKKLRRAGCYERLLELVQPKHHFRGEEFAILIDDVDPANAVNYRFSATLWLNSREEGYLDDPRLSDALAGAYGMKLEDRKLVNAKAANRGCWPKIVKYFPSSRDVVP